ncbi:MAG TPA: hypothetical protein VFC84_20655 [Desulfosporosinus sp.]|nr:hypothetical protein [Desulfosporosinus sp.]
MFKCFIDYIEALQPNSVAALAALSNFTIALASCMNILIVIVFYTRDKRLRLKEYKSKIKMNWYRVTLLDKNLLAIDTFFEKDLQIIEEIEKISPEGISKHDYDKIIKKQIGLYTDKKIALSLSFTDLVSIIEVRMGQELDELLEQFQDEFINHISSQDSLAPDIGRKLVYGHKKRFFKLLFNYEWNDFKPSKRARKNSVFAGFMAWQPFGFLSRFDRSGTTTKM